jgi:hypothetical protein
MRQCFLLALCLACAGKDEISGGTGAETDTDTDSDADTDTEVPCTATVVSLDPADGAVGVALDTEIVATFSEPVAEGRFDLGIDGVTGDLALAGDGLTATFTPDVDLAQDTTYQVNATACDSSLAGSFTTAGDEVDALALEGRTYGIRWESLQFSEPDPFAVAFLPIDITHVLVGVQSYDPVTDALIAAAATAYDDNGALGIDCTASISGIEADFTGNPSFQVGPEDFVIANDPYDPYDDYIIEDFSLTGSFSADSTQILGPHITGKIDARAFGYDCGTFGALVNCLPCDDGEPQCAEVDAYAVSANDLTSSADLIGFCGL